MRQLKKKIANFLIGKKGFVAPLTDAADISRLIYSLSPIKTSKDLIRLGPDGDGGYLVPDDLVGVEACFSPGVNLVSDFEKACADRGMQVFLADKSVDSPAVLHQNFQFTKKYIGAFNDNDFMTIDSWVSGSLINKECDLILQIDIEGYEYEVFLSCSEKLMSRFRIIVAEFHDLDQLWNRPFYLMASRVFEKINKTHACVHIHPNNYYGVYKKFDIEMPKLAEFTFLRNDRIESFEYEKNFPHPLDRDNTKNKTIVLPNSWLRK
ncbi:FkbM family methyltransferase [Geoalkalibacter sp.]|uniref:FkbM family methyltransferase n=1 Tax=Geoalkalibacter sp. TaxID=3041440 RepID=UPI00272E77F2|nr:FkbM family methyltransferase [Geoalkalibacter sp.]